MFYLESRVRRSLLRGLVITRPPAYVRNMSLAEIEQAVNGLNREELAKLASYIPARCAPRALIRCSRWRTTPNES